MSYEEILIGIDIHTDKVTSTRVSSLSRGRAVVVQAVK